MLPKRPNSQATPEKLEGEEPGSREQSPSPENPFYKHQFIESLLEKVSELTEIPKEREMALFLNSESPETQKGNRSLEDWRLKTVAEEEEDLQSSWTFNKNQEPINITTAFEVSPINEKESCSGTDLEKNDENFLENGEKDNELLSYEQIRKRLLEKTEDFKSFQLSEKNQGAIPSENSTEKAKITKNGSKEERKAREKPKSSSLEDSLDPKGLFKNQKDSSTSQRNTNQSLETSKDSLNDHHPSLKTAKTPNENQTPKAPLGFHKITSLDLDQKPSTSENSESLLLSPVSLLNSLFSNPPKNQSFEEKDEKQVDEFVRKIQAMIKENNFTESLSLKISLPQTQSPQQEASFSFSNVVLDDKIEEIEGEDEGEQIATVHFPSLKSSHHENCLTEPSDIAEDLLKMEPETKNHYFSVKDAPKNQRRKECSYDEATQDQTTSSGPSQHPKFLRKSQKGKAEKDQRERIGRGAQIVKEIEEKPGNRRENQSGERRNETKKLERSSSKEKEGEFGKSLGILSMRRPQRSQRYLKREILTRQKELKMPIDSKELQKEINSKIIPSLPMISERKPLVSFSKTHLIHGNYRANVIASLNESKENFILNLSTEKHNKTSKSQAEISKNPSQREQNEDTPSFVPQICEKSRRMSRNIPVSQILYMDAVQRQSRSHSNGPETQSNQANFLYWKEANNAKGNPASLPRSNRIVLQNFQNEYNAKFESVAGQMDQIGKEETLELFKELGFVKAPDSNLYEMGLFEEFWKLLSGETTGNSLDKLHLRAFCTSLFGVFDNLKADMKKPKPFDVSKPKKKNDIFDIEGNPVKRHGSSFGSFPRNECSDSLNSQVNMELNEEGEFSTETTQFILRKFSSFYTSRMNQYKGNQTKLEREPPFVPKLSVSEKYTRFLAQKHMKRVIDQASLVLPDKQKLEEMRKIQKMISIERTPSSFSRQQPKPKKEFHFSLAKKTHFETPNATPDHLKEQDLFEIAKQKAKESKSQKELVNQKDLQKEKGTREKDTRRSFSNGNGFSFQKQQWDKENDSRNQGMKAQNKRRISFDVFVTPAKKERVSLSDPSEIPQIVEEFSKKHKISLHQKLILKNQMDSHAQSLFQSCS